MIINKIYTFTKIKIMKKLLLILFLLPIVLCSQDSERVLEIQKMYNKITDKDNRKTGEECKSVKWKNDNLTSYSRDFCESSECVYPDDFSTIELSYYLGKGRYDINIQRWIGLTFYLKDDNLYFAKIDEIKDNKRTDGKEYDITKPNFTETSTSIYFKENGEVEKMLIRNETTVDGKQISRTEDLIEDEKKSKKIKGKTLRFLKIAKQQLNLTEEERERQRAQHKREEQYKRILEQSKEVPNISAAEKDAKKLAECVCELMEISQEMSDPDKAAGLKNKMEEQSEKCQKIEKEIEEKVLKAKNTNNDYEIGIAMKKAMKDCEYLNPPPIINDDK